MKKILSAILAITLTMTFTSVAHAQITKDQYYARSTLSGNELEYYDDKYAYMAGERINTQYADYGLDLSDAKRIVNYVWADAPELFRQGELYTDEEANELQTQIDAKTDEIFSLVTGDMSE